MKCRHHASRYDLAVQQAVKSHISKKAEKKIKDKTHELVKEIQRPQGGQTGYEAVNKYNAYVIGIHNYYALETLVSVDFSQFYG